MFCYFPSICEIFRSLVWQNGVYWIGYHSSLEMHVMCSVCNFALIAHGTSYEVWWYLNPHFSCTRFDFLFPSKQAHHIVLRFNASKPYRMILLTASGIKPCQSMKHLSSSLFQPQHQIYRICTLCLV